MKYPAIKGLPLKANKFNQIVTKDGFVIAHNVRSGDDEYLVQAANLLPELLEIARQVEDGNFNQAHLINRAKKVLAKVKS